MKMRFRLLALGAALAAAAPGFAQPTPPAPPQVLHVIITPPLEGPRTGNRMYVLVANYYSLAFRHRKWPIQISTEEFGGGPVQNDGQPELDVFVQPIHEYLPRELTYSAWTVLKVNGRKYDLGVITYEHDLLPVPRGPLPNFAPYQRPDAVMEDLLEGAARETIRKIEPILFPKGR